MVGQGVPNVKNFIHVYIPLFSFPYFHVFLDKVFFTIIWHKIIKSFALIFKMNCLEASFNFPDNILTYVNFYKNSNQFISFHESSRPITYEIINQYARVALSFQLKCSISKIY